ncbi:MAG: sugar phosphate isomerase/epimerase family protein [Thermoguttaceae bacterium]
MKRRTFLWSGLAAGAGLGMISATSKTVAAQETTFPGDQREKAKLRFSSQLGIIPGNSDEEKLKKMKEWGFEAVELGGVGNDVDDWKKKVEDAGLLVSAFCWGSQNGDLVSDRERRQKNAVEAFKKNLEGSAKLGGTGVIHVPAFNQQSQLSVRDLRDRVLEYLPEIGKFAHDCGTFVILEPLSRQEAFYMRQVSDAARIAQECNKIAGCEGVRVMGDFYHMYNEEANDMGAFLSAGPLLQHVHLANGPKRTLPGQVPSHRFVNGFRGLKYIGYDKFVSFECGVDGDREVEVPKSLEFLRAEWDLA